MITSLFFRTSLLAISVSLVACGGGSGGSSNNDQSPDSADNSTDTPSAGDQNTDNSDTGNALSDSTWSAGNDRILGIGFNGNSDTPEVTMMKAAPVSGQDGDVFSIRSATYPATELSEIKSIDNLMDRRDFQDMDIMSYNNESYVVACQDGSDTTGYTSAVSLHIFKTSDTSKVAEIDLIGSNFEARECAELSAQFTQGTSDAMGAKVFYAGATQQTSGPSPLTRNDRVLEITLTIDTSLDMDASGAVMMDSLASLATASFGDKISGVTSWGARVYYTAYSGSSGLNFLAFKNTLASGSNPITVSSSANDPFVPGVAQQMLVKDMFVIPGEQATDFDHIYIVSDSYASGIVVAGYRPDVDLKQAMALSQDAAVENCSDVVTGVSDQGVGQKLWCHDATDSGNIIEVYSPVQPGN